MDFSIRESRNTHASLDNVGDVCGEMWEKRIVIGSVARRLEKRKDDKFAYQWRVYIRDEHNEDLSTYIRKVVFRMHTECAQPIAIMNQTPFEVTNYSNIEFPITITILYNDMRQSCTIHHHDLKLNNDDDDDSNSTEPKQAIVDEKLEAITFVNPTDEMKLCFKQGTTKRLTNDAEIMIRQLAIEENWPKMMSKDSMQMLNNSECKEHDT